MFTQEFLKINRPQSRLMHIPPSAQPVDVDGLEVRRDGEEGRPDEPPALAEGRDPRLVGGEPEVQRTPTGWSGAERRSRGNGTRIRSMRMVGTQQWTLVGC